MIELPRALARQLSAVLRRCFRKPNGSHPPTVEFHAGVDGLRAWVAHHEVAVEYCQPGPRPTATLRLPLDALAAFAGRDDEAVTLEAVGEDKVLARWHDAGVPQVVEYDPPNTATLTAFPALPAEFTSNPPALMSALDEAVRSTAPEATRYAMHRLQLRGRTGQVAATDGKQLLVQGGFAFGWPEAVLVPAVPIFGGRDLGRDEPADVGRTADHIVVRTCGWTVWLRIDTAGRFPDVDLVVPRSQSAGTRLRLGPADTAFLARTLPRLPGRADDEQPVTLELNGRAVIRARAAGQARTTEVVLAQSDCTGHPVQVCLNREHLARALRLGLSELQVGKAAAPVLFRDDQRSYVVLPLPPAGVLPPTDDALRIESEAETRPLKIHQPERTTPVMTKPTSNGHLNGHAPTQTATTESPEKSGVSLGALVAEAQALRDAARDVYSRAGRLATAVQRHRRQSRLVATTLASLRQLQQIGG